MPALTKVLQPLQKLLPPARPLRGLPRLFCHVPPSLEVGVLQATAPRRPIVLKCFPSSLSDSAFRIPDSETVPFHPAGKAWIALPPLILAQCREMSKFRICPSLKPFRNVVGNRNRRALDLVAQAVAVLERRVLVSAYTCRPNSMAARHTGRSSNRWYFMLLTFPRPYRFPKSNRNWNSDIRIRLRSSVSISEIPSPMPGIPNSGFTNVRIPHFGFQNSELHKFRSANPNRVDRISEFGIRNSES